jgi:hypothetical protein
MTTGTAFILLDFGLGALLVAKQGSPREDPRAPSLNEELRARAIEAQRASARASQRSRELTSRWLEQEARLRDRGP